VSDAWLFITKSDDERSWAANQGYDDAVGSHYSYDSNVPNCQRVKAGDLVVIRQDDWVAGWGVISEITVSPDTVKEISRCPNCGRTNWYPRMTISPPLKCSSCRHEFGYEALVKEMSRVTAYRANYASSWVEAARPISYRDLEPYIASQGTFNAIRPLKADTVDGLLTRIDDRRHDLTLQTEAGTLGVILGGHDIATVRRRKGQRQFRFRMMERFGEWCAFSGAQPPQVLEAAHLYSFAERPEHHHDGGLLLRRDIHSLFDAHLVAINPSSWKIEISERLETYPAYWNLHRTDLKLRSEQRPNRDLVAAHHATFAAS
jgi:hypothetical protein